MAQVVSNRFENIYAYITGGKKRRDGNPYLQDNFAPVHDELFKEDLEVEEGAMPLDLDGLFIRNGPNPQFTPTGDYHWFDGDGHVHACLIRGGKVSYCNRYVQTNRLHQEKAAGFPVYGKFGDMVGLSGLGMVMWDSLKKYLGIISEQGGAGTGNTALAYHAGRLLALHEGDLPYQLRVLCNGLIETVGRVSLEAADPAAKYGDRPFTAHPKIDPKTGEMVFFGYQVDKQPHCVTAVADTEGRVLRTVPVPLPGGVMMHDCAITQDYTVVLDTNLVFDPQNMVKARSLPFRFDKSRPARFGLLRRDATDASRIQWFETDPVMIFHVANAWQEEKDGGHLVKMYACTFKEFDLDLSNVEKAFPTDDHKQRLYEFTFDTTTGKADMRLFADVCGDFPVVPASQVGYPSRYAYIAEMDTSLKVAKFTGVAKVDLQCTAGPEAAVVGRFSHGEGRYGGEAYYVPASSPSSEDDGYLITYVHDEAAGETSLVVYSARSMASRPVASVKLPQRVPYGFHCLHVPQAQLAKQRST